MAGPSIDSSIKEFTRSRPNDLLRRPAAVSWMSKRRVRYSPRSPIEGYGRSIVETPTWITIKKIPWVGNRIDRGIEKAPTRAVETNAKNVRSSENIMRKKYHLRQILIQI